MQRGHKMTTDPGVILIAHAHGFNKASRASTPTCTVLPARRGSGGRRGRRHSGRSGMNRPNPMAPAARWTRCRNTSCQEGFRRGPRAALLQELRTFEPGPRCTVLSVLGGAPHSQHAGWREAAGPSMRTEGGLAASQPTPSHSRVHSEAVLSLSGGSCRLRGDRLCHAVSSCSPGEVQGSCKPPRGHGVT